MFTSLRYDRFIITSIAMAVESFQLSLHDYFTVSVALLDNVTNIKELKQCVMDQTFDVTLIKPSMIVDMFQVLSAANKAVHLHRHNKRVTKTLHSELLYSLSPSKNISDCFRKFGSADTESCVLIAEIHKNDDSRLSSDVLPKVQGNLISLDKLSSYSDVPLIKKVYKVKDDPELLTGPLLDSVVGRMACKEFVSF